jgi:hypothetical protein
VPGHRHDVGTLSMRRRQQDHGTRLEQTIDFDQGLSRADFSLLSAFRLGQDRSTTTDQRRADTHPCSATELGRGSDQGYMRNAKSPG